MDSEFHFCYYDLIFSCWSRKALLYWAIPCCLTVNISNTKSILTTIINPLYNQQRNMILGGDSVKCLKKMNLPLCNCQFFPNVYKRILGNSLRCRHPDYGWLTSGERSYISFQKKPVLLFPLPTGEKNKIAISPLHYSIWR